MRFLGWGRPRRWPQCRTDETATLPSRSTDPCPAAHAGPRRRRCRPRGRGGVLPILDCLGRRSRTRVALKLPGYWDRAFDYLGAQEHPGRVLVLPASERGRYRWGGVHDNLFDDLPLAGGEQRVAPGDCRKRRSSRGRRRFRQFHRLRQGHARADTGAARRALGPAENDLDREHGSVPRPSTYEPRPDPDLRIAATFGCPARTPALWATAMRSSLERSRCRWRFPMRSLGIPPRDRGSPPAHPFWSPAAGVLALAGDRGAARRAARRLHRSRRQ